MSELTIKDKLRGIDYLITVKVQNNPVGFDGAVIDARLRLKEESVDRIMQLIESAITEAQEERIKQNKSFCGCSMCTHHSEPYEAQLKDNTTKEEL